MIVALESLRLALSSLRANPLRAVLTILGIVIGVAAVVALTSIGSGSTRAVENRFNAFGTDTITVQTSRFVERHAADRQRPGRHRRDPRGQGTVTSVNTNATVTAGSTSATGDDQRHLAADRRIDHLTVAAGTFFSDFDRPQPAGGGAGQDGGRRPRPDAAAAPWVRRSTSAACSSR